ncbi:MAG: hypothetical protein ACK4K0_08615 [Flavobacteriales bacterium]
MKYKLLVIAFVGIYAIRANAQNLAFNSTSTESLFSKKDYSLVLNYTQRDSVKSKSLKFFIAYDFGEAAFNQFKSLGGEVGVRFKNNHLLRLTHTNLHLTEKHLSSNFAKAVDGKNVKGKQFGFELFYDFPVFVKGLYIAPSVGYYDNEYTHTTLNEKLEKSSFTAGTAISFTEMDLFKVKGLYYRVSVPFRFNFDPIKETKLGDTTIKSNLFENNIWLFVGFQF